MNRAVMPYYQMIDVQTNAIHANIDDLSDTCYKEADELVNEPA